MLKKHTKQQKKQIEKTKLLLMANGSIRAIDMRVWKGRQFENIQKLDVI